MCIDIHQRMEVHPSGGTGFLTGAGLPDGRRQRTIAQTVLFVLALALGLTSSYTSAADPSANVKDISTFVDCLNSEGKAGRIKSIADTVRCIPKQCTVTLTMSDMSSQRACALGPCQLPRVILTCPGPAADKKLRPSYLLCPIMSQTQDQGEIGMNRVEMTEDLTKLDFDQRPPTGSMKGADIPIPSNVAFKEISKEGILNKVPENPIITDGTKGCNVCHKNVTPRPDKAGEIEPMPPINPFGELLGGQEGLPFIIHSDEKDKDSKPKQDGLKPKAPFRKETLAQICDCINTKENEAKILADAKLKDPNAMVNLGVMRNLCGALQTYQERRGICGKDLNKQQPDPPGLVCALVRGGGKFLLQLAVSTLRLDLSGTASLDESGSSFSAVQVSGSLLSYEYSSRKHVQSVLFSSAQGTLFGGGDFTLTTEGIAIVNSLRTNIRFDVTKAGNMIEYEIRDIDSGEFLGGGIGELGRAALEFVTSEP